MKLITKSIIDVSSIIEAVKTDESGGIDVFIGTTRSHSGGKNVQALEYEAYEPMALRMMDEIEREARSKWNLHKVAMVHRIGRVGIGEASVVIAVSSVHRKEAFEACRYLIDRLKTVVPIWKREYFSDGTIEWSGSSEHVDLPARI